MFKKIFFVNLKKVFNKKKDPKCYRILAGKKLLSYYGEIYNLL